MAFTTSLWLVDGGSLKAQSRTTLASEKALEGWIVADMSLLGEDLLLIGRQVRTAGGPLDLLAIDAEGTLVIAELKRDGTPREVVAQVLDYASWVRSLSVADVDALCQRFSGKPLADLFRSHFDVELPESACEAHRMLIVAAELDDSSERIIRYLQEDHGVDVNAVFFSAFPVAGQTALVRAWLADPVQIQERSERRERAAWGGTWFVNTGVSDANTRDWELCRSHGFTSAGGGEVYSRPLFKLELGDPIAAYRKGRGYVGVGTVTATAVPADEFTLADGRPLSTVSQLRGARGDPKAEHVVGVEWLRTVPEAQAKTFTGAFANPLVVCKLRDAATLKFLEAEFGLGSVTAAPG
jgi:hypothetical protein